MKYLVGIVLLAYVLAGPVQDKFKAVGQECQSANVVFVNSFFVNPWPPKGCGSQAVSLTGTFDSDYCVERLYIQEYFNGNDSYDQIVNISQCFNKNEQTTFNFNFSPFQCIPGSYTMKVNIQANYQQATIGCWQYSYNL